ncbi:protein chibby homolog 3 [Terrapene carolina triunguis]|uniref:protein chibby homolog 3 n=1 Tax=Terrapene triunguis TaxID=2587831 RepID=UPI000CEF9138|nr:protein chibby homolog 3 [Terrapene carolina triunguis]
MNTIANIMQELRDYWADHFSRRFLPKRPPLRRITSISTFYLLDHRTRQAELGLDYGPPRAQLSDAKFVFQDGKWQGESGLSHRPPLLQLFSSHDREQSCKVMKKENKALLEENNYLKLQLELLMDMLTETTARLHMVEKKMDIPTRHTKMKKPNKVLMLKS